LRFQRTDERYQLALTTAAGEFASTRTAYIDRQDLGEMPGKGNGTGT